MAKLWFVIWMMWQYFHCNLKKFEISPFLAVFFLKQLIDKTITNASHQLSRRGIGQRKKTYNTTSDNCNVYRTVHCDICHTLININTRQTVCTGLKTNKPKRCRHARPSSSVRKGNSHKILTVGPCRCCRLLSTAPHVAHPVQQCLLPLSVLLWINRSSQQHNLHY